MSWELFGITITLIIPCTCGIMVISRCSYRLRKNGKTFNYTLTDGLAAILALSPTPGIAVYLSSLDHSMLALAVVPGVVALQLAGVVLAKTRTALRNDGRGANFIVIVLFGLLGILIYAMWLLVFAIAMVVFGPRYL
jgi:hypothetical protein